MSDSVSNVNNQSIESNKMYGCCSKNLRWFMLFTLCVVIYSFVYCYELNTFQTDFENQSNIYKMKTIEYQMLYSVYGYINIIAPILVSLMVDKIGINTTTCLLGFLIFLGQSLFLISLFPKMYNYPFMIVSRIIFGIGAENFHLSRKWLLYHHFSGLEYMFASGLSLSSSRLGSASQSNIGEFVFSKYNNSLIAAITVGWGLVTFSFFVLLLFLFVQKKIFASVLSDSSTKTKRVNKTEYEKAKNDDDVQEDKPPTDGLEMTTIPENEEKKSQVLESEEEVESNNHKDEENRFHIGALLRCKFDLRFWLLGLVLISFYSSYLAYSTVNKAYLIGKFQFSRGLASSLQSIPFWISAVFTPIFGYIQDRCGNRCWFMFAAGFFLLVGHLLLGFFDVDLGSPRGSNKAVSIASTGLSFLGLGYSIGASAVWPCFGIIVEKKHLATALGFWSCVDNGFQATMFVVVGALANENTTVIAEKYNKCRFLWIGLSLCMIVFTMVLWCRDRRYHGNVLSKPELKYIR